MKKHTKKFLIVDGLDGSGKGTVVQAIQNHLKKQGLEVFDLKTYWKEHNDIPDIEKLDKYDVIVSAEPSYVYVGKAIRDEIVRKNKRRYSALSTAQAFALDRELLYRKLIISALEKNKIVVLERGVVTSLVYQPVQLERINLKDILNLPGNRLALQNAPSLLIITKVSPEVVVQRLKDRDKKDHAIFENLVFQRKIADRYESDWIRKLFENKGSKVVYLDTDYPKSVEQTTKEAIKIWDAFFS